MNKSSKTIVGLLVRSFTQCSSHTVMVLHLKLLVVSAPSFELHGREKKASMYSVLGACYVIVFNRS